MPILSIDGVPIAELEDGPFAAHLQALARQRLGYLRSKPVISMNPPDTSIMPATRFSEMVVSEQTFDVDLSLRFTESSKVERPR